MKNAKQRRRMTNDKKWEARRLTSIRNFFGDLSAAGSRLACPPRASFSKPSMPQKTASGQTWRS
jgi:hypothetical protein